MSIRSTHRTGLECRAEPTFPMSASFKPVLAACTAFPGFHANGHRQRKKQYFISLLIYILTLLSITKTRFPAHDVHEKAKQKIKSTLLEAKIFIHAFFVEFSSTLQS